MTDKKVIMSYDEYESLQDKIKTLKEEIESLRVENQNLKCPAGHSLYLIYRKDWETVYRVMPPEQDRTELEHALVSANAKIEELKTKCTCSELLQNHVLRLETINKELIDNIDKLEKQLSSIKSTWGYKLYKKFSLK